MSVVEGRRADIKICCVRSTSTGTRRVVRPSGWGVVNSLARRGCGPVALIHAQKLGIKYKKPLRDIPIHLIKPHVGKQPIERGAAYDERHASGDCLVLNG